MSKTSLPKLAETPKSGQNGRLKISLQGLRIRPEELPEITHNCWRDWDEILMEEYFRRHFQDLESICPDPMMITNVPKYVSYTLPVLDAGVDFRKLLRADSQPLERCFQSAVLATLGGPGSFFG